MMGFELVYCFDTVWYCWAGSSSNEGVACEKTVRFDLGTNKNMTYGDYTMNYGN